MTILKTSFFCNNLWLILLTSSLNVVLSWTTSRGPLRFVAGGGALGAVAPQQLGSFEPLVVDKDEPLLQPRRVLLEDEWLSECIPFEVAWERQRDYWQQHAQRLE